MTSKPSKNKLLNFLEDEKHESHVCGQNRALIVHLKNELKTKNIEELLDSLTSIQYDIQHKLQQTLQNSNINMDEKLMSTGVSIGNPLKDTQSTITKDNFIVIKFIMDPLYIDCKQRTFISKEINSKVRKLLFHALYKYTFGSNANDNDMNVTSDNLNVNSAKSHT